MVVPVLLVVLVVPVLPEEPVVLVVLVEPVPVVEVVPVEPVAAGLAVTIGVEEFDVPELVLPVLLWAVAVVSAGATVVVGVVEAVPPPQPASTRPEEARTRANFFFGIS